MKYFKAFLAVTCLWMSAAHAQDPSQIQYLEFKYTEGIGIYDDLNLMARTFSDFNSYCSQQPAVIQALNRVRNDGSYVIASEATVRKDRLTFHFKIECKITFTNEYRDSFQIK